MSRFIDADMVEYFKTFNPDKGEKTIADMAWRSDIDAIPTADVSPVVYGKWEECEIVQEDGDYKIIDEWQSARCSACGKYHTTPYMYHFDHFNYCPNCGADMRGETDEQIH